MRVKVHPHRNLVNAGVEACVSVTPDRKYGRAYYMGTVMLNEVSFRIHDSGVQRAQREQVRNVHAWAVGNIMSESPEQYPPSNRVQHTLTKVTYHFNIGRFIAEDGTDVTDGHFRVAYFCGRDFYVSKEW
jgi:hypothetical protein